MDAGTRAMSEFLSHFHFLRPWWLFALIVLPVLWRALWQRGVDGEVWRGAVDAHLLEHLLVRGDARPARAPHVLLASAWIVACAALAGPAWERLPQPLYQSRAARVIALELAPTMRAQDVKPSRVERARFKIADMLKRSGDAQTALIAYAGDAFVVAPLTDDANTVANLLDALEPSVMPVDGNDTGRAIDLGVKLVQQAGMHAGEIVLVADSVSDNAAAMATRAHAAGIRVSVLGIGTTQGAPVATAGGFLQDRSGKIVMPKLDASALAAVATAGGGRYASYTTDAQDLNDVLDDLRPFASDQSTLVEAQSPRFLDRGPWLLLLLVPMAALGFRRGWLMLLPLVLLMQPRQAEAFSWNDLWQRPDQQAQVQLDAGNAKQAQALARDPDLRGASAYRADDFAAAAQDFQRPETQATNADTHYNLGNALAKLQKFPEAIAAYDAALKQAPEMADAAANKKAVEDWMKKQQQQKQQGDNGKNGKSSDAGKNQDGKPDQDGKDQQGEQQDSSQKDSGSDSQAQNRQSQDQQKDARDQAGQQGQDSNNQSDAKQGSAAEKNADDQARHEANAQAAGKGADQQAQQKFQQGMDQALKESREQGDKRSQPVRLGARENGARDEKQEAVEQWLQRVPDDPGGLLRRKFQLESQRRLQNQQAPGDSP
jgi:Ca-activated chloride channel family protein